MTVVVRRWCGSMRAAVLAGMGAAALVAACGDRPTAPDRPRGAVIANPPTPASAARRVASLHLVLLPTIEHDVSYVVVGAESATTPSFLSPIELSSPGSRLDPRWIARRAVDPALIPEGVSWTGAALQLFDSFGNECEGRTSRLWIVRGVTPVPAMAAAWSSSSGRDVADAVWRHGAGYLVAEIASHDCPDPPIVASRDRAPLTLWDPDPKQRVDTLGELDGLPEWRAIVAAHAGRDGPWDANRGMAFQDEFVHPTRGARLVFVGAYGPERCARRDELTAATYLRDGDRLRLVQVDVGPARPGEAGAPALVIEDPRGELRLINADRILRRRPTGRFELEAEVRFPVLDRGC